ncbi:MAG: phosphotransferase [Planctomycetes bacterium]|nr:phosphotransferase [Planctomycetota bacterium]
MVKGGANFSSEELVRVLSHYDIGIVHRVQQLPVGNRRAPKVIVTADKGTFLLKRRPKGRDDLEKVGFAHAVQKHLAARSFPVTSLLATMDDGGTALNMDNHIYEFFRYVEGTRYDGSLEATREAGRQLAVFHKDLADFQGKDEPSPLCFHDAALVRRHLKLLSSDKRTEAARRMRAVAEELLLRYDKSSVRVNQLGFRSWKRQVVHGDWHPGNLLFGGNQVVAVVDFDSIRYAPAVTDLANGMLQFSIVGDRPDPTQWSAHFDRSRLFEFFYGYQEVTRLSERKRYGLIDMMIETMIAEAVLPVAATGFFGYHSGQAFLEMILRKTKWLRRNRRELREVMMA